MNNTYSDHYSGYSVADSVPSERASFIRKTYLHLAGALLVFAGLEFLLINSPIAVPMAQLMTGGWSWLIVLGAFMGVSYVAQSWANSQTSVAMQYLGLGLFVVAEAVIFLPLLLIASMYFPGAIMSAILMTVVLFAALTATVFVTRTDFSFLGPILMIGGFVALGFIVLSIAFGFSLGIVFSTVMALFAAGAILYNTSNVMRQYGTDQHVAAALSLFASVALLFWYILQIFMSRDE